MYDARISASRRSVFSAISSDEPTNCHENGGLSVTPGGNVKSRLPDFTLLAWVAGLLLLFVATGCDSGDVVDIDFFYSEVCPSCDTYRKAESIRDTLAFIAQKNRSIAAESHNLIDPAANTALRKEIEERGFPDISNSVPILMIDDKYYIGYDDIEAAIAALPKSE